MQIFGIFDAFVIDFPAMRIVYILLLLVWFLFALILCYLPVCSFNFPSDQQLVLAHLNEGVANKRC